MGSADLGSIFARSCSKSVPVNPVESELLRLWSPNSGHSIRPSCLSGFSVQNQSPVGGLPGSTHTQSGSGFTDKGMPLSAS